MCDDKTTRSLRVFRRPVGAKDRMSDKNYCESFVRESALGIENHLVRFVSSGIEVELINS